MSTAKHTAGPWHRNIAPATKYNTVWSGRNKHVARVVVDGGLTPEEVEANIRLIAAAPELLEALIELRRVELEDCADASDILAMRAKCDAAIARATEGDE